MRVILFFLLICLIFSNLHAQKLDWVYQMGFNPASTAIDKNGNIFVAGNIESATDFDLGLGIDMKIGSNYVAKYDSLGNSLWVKQFGGNGSSVKSVAVDDSGYCYIAGTIVGLYDFNSNNILNNNDFLCKLTGSGVFNWVKPISKYISSIKVVRNYIYLIDEIIKLGGGLGNYFHYENINFSKLDLDGNMIWKKSYNTCSETHFSNKDFVLDNNDNIYFKFELIVNCCNLNGTTYSSSDGEFFIFKLDFNGNLNWVKQIHLSINSQSSICYDNKNNKLLLTQALNDTIDADPGPFVYNVIPTNSGYDNIISKLDTAGNFIWAKVIGGKNPKIATDDEGSVFVTGQFEGTEDFDPDPNNQYLLSSSGLNDVFTAKYDSSGNFIWTYSISSNLDDDYSQFLTQNGSLYLLGSLGSTADFDPSNSIFNLSSSVNNEYFIQKIHDSNPKIKGYLFFDLNNNCEKDSLENTILGSININIQPGNLTIQSQTGHFYIDSLPSGTYTATIDTSGQWKATCSNSVTFTVVHPDSFVQITPLGLKNINNCAKPEISIIAPTLRRCFSNQYIYLQATNLFTATQIMYNSYADVKLDSFLTINSSTIPYTSLGNYIYRFQLDSIYPGQSKNWEISTTVSCSTVLGQTLCLQANLFPVAECSLDTIPNEIIGVSPCLGPWDNSSLKVDGQCIGDSIRFVITNSGSNMDCFMPIRIYVDGVLTTLDSLKLVGGDSLVIKIAGDGKTWRLETDQHPLHPGNSHPNATVEACGDQLNWTSGLVATMSQDDADPVVDIYCGQVMGSFDPNDKTGYPLGILEENYILPNQQLQYFIRFQNTGTDTAFKVVIRDTLETDLNIFSVVSGVSSHPYSFRMYGSRILEWTFNNIMLPDSFVNEPKSHGFITFTVNQNPNLSDGTKIENKAAIYFDNNSPVITNVAHHEINDWKFFAPVSIDKSQNIADIKVYPNPNNGLFKVELPSNMPSTPLRQQKSKLTICNVMGQVVYISNTFNDQSTEIDLSKQPNGIYFLKVENGEMEWNKKVVKN